MDDADIARVRFIGLRYTPSHILARLLIASQFTHLHILWPPYGIGQTIIFLPCGFFLSFFFSRLISAAADRMSTILPHMVWP